MARARHSGSMCVAVAPSWPVRGAQPSASCAPTCVACFPTAARFPQSPQIFLVPPHDRPGLGTRGLAAWAEVREMALVSVPGLCIHPGTQGPFLLSRQGSRGTEWVGGPAASHSRQSLAQAQFSLSPGPWGQASVEALEAGLGRAGRWGECRGVGCWAEGSGP